MGKIREYIGHNFGGLARGTGVFYDLASYLGDLVVNAARHFLAILLGERRNYCFVCR